MSLAAATMIAVPAPSSTAPVPWSQLSRCAPSSTNSSGLPLPRTSAMTFCECAPGT